MTPNLRGPIPDAVGSMTHNSCMKRFEQLAWSHSTSHQLHDCNANPQCDRQQITCNTHIITYTDTNYYLRKIFRNNDFQKLRISLVILWKVILSRRFWGCKIPRKLWTIILRELFSQIRVRGYIHKIGNFRSVRFVLLCGPFGQCLPCYSSFFFSDLSPDGKSVDRNCIFRCTSCLKWNLWSDGDIRCNLWLKVGHNACLILRNREYIIQVLRVFTVLLCQRPPELAFKSSQ